MTSNFPIEQGPKRSIKDVPKETLIKSTMNWTQYFFKMALFVSEKSKDPSTKVGCVITKERRVLSTGYNGFPKYVRDTVERYNNRDLKYEMVVHAELNAICQAAKYGVSLDGAHIYITFPPCSNCAAIIIQAGIVEIDWLVLPEGHETSEKWKQSHEIAMMMFKEAPTIVHPWARTGFGESDFAE